MKKWQFLYVPINLENYVKNDNRKFQKKVLKRF
jgi:hypothetical protein